MNFAYKSALRSSLLVLGLVFIASSLRAPITAVAPVIDNLQSTFARSPALAGFLTTPPLIAFGILAAILSLFMIVLGLQIKSADKYEASIINTCATMAFG